MAKTEEKKNPENEIDDLDELVSVEIPMDGTEADDYPEYVYFNSRRFLIKKGEAVQLPRCVANLLAESREAKKRAREYARKKSLSAADAEFRKRYNLG